MHRRRGANLSVAHRSEYLMKILRTKHLCSMERSGRQQSQRMIDTFNSDSPNILKSTNPKHTVDRVPKKSKFAERPAEFSVYSRGKYKNFLLTKFLKILQNVRAHQQLM